MPSVIRNVLTAPHKDNVVLAGGFQFNGASAPTTTTGRWISSVAHTSTGVWTVTMGTEYWNWQKKIAMTATLELDASALSFVTLGAATASAGTLVVRAYTESASTLALADIAAGSNDGNWCHLALVLKYTTAVDGS